MGLGPQIITDSLYEEIKIAYGDLDKISRRAVRLRTLMTAKECGVGVAAKAFGVCRTTIQFWGKRFAEEGVEGLDYKPGRGRKSHLADEHYNAIAEWIENDSGLTVKDIVLKLTTTFGIQTSISAVQRVMKKLGLSYITPRPVHHKQEEKNHDIFKKKSEEGG